jgi:hypothetical protein
MDIDKIIKQLARNSDKVSVLDAKFLTGQIKEIEYRNKRNSLKAQAKKIVQKHQLNRFGDVSNIIN